VRGLGQDTGIGVGSSDDAGVTEHLLDNLQVSTRGQRERRRPVPQVMQPDRRQAQLPDQLAEPVGQVLGPDADCRVAAREPGP
jgi:hypothetical protein